MSDRQRVVDRINWPGEVINATLYLCVRVCACVCVCVCVNEYLEYFNMDVTA